MVSLFEEFDASEKLVSAYTYYWVYIIHFNY